MNKPKIRFNGFEGEWKEKALGDVVDEFKYGINAAAVSYDGENKYLRITDIDEGSRAFIKDELASPDADLSSCNEYIMQDGDIVIARTGASVGKSYIYHPIDGKVYFAGFLIRARVNKNVDREFVFQNTLTDGFKKYIRFVSQRSGQPGVNAEELKSYLMNLPASLPEQRALASYFTSLDAQIAASTSRLSSLKQIKAASLLNMFPQKGETVPRVRFKGFQGEWKDSMLSDFSYSICSGRDTAHKGIYPLYGSTGIIGTTNKPSYNGAMLLVARVGANAGKLQIINEECGVSDNTLIIKPNGNISVSWLYYYLVHCNLNHLVYGSGQPLITGYMLKRIPILLGSKKECDEIASYFTTLDAQITLQRERLEKLKQIKAACLEKMFA